MTFHNLTPAIPGFYSDPTMCAGPDGVYVAHSSFEYFPGLPVFRSTDLATFTQIGHVLDRPDQLDLATFAGASAGTYGSTIRHHEGTYYFITTNIGQVRQGHAIFTATDPAGPWSDPVFTTGIVGIDPDLAWDDDGTCYLTWCGFPDGIQQVTVNPATGEVLSAPRFLWAGTGGKAPEGPHLYQVGDWWYLMIAEGGTEKGHMVNVARSRRPDGDFEPAPQNPILTHRSTGHPVQAAGHADLVEWDGRWWACYHGIRPHGMTPEYHVLGRETFVCPLEWVDEWPVFREDLAVAHPVATSLDTAFEGPLELRWTSPQGDLSNATVSPDGLMLAEGRPVVVRVQDLNWFAEADLDVSRGTARLLVYLDDDHWYAVEADAQGVRARARSKPFEQELGRVDLADPSSVTVRLSATIPQASPIVRTLEPDLIGFAVVAGDEVTELASVDGRHASTEVAGGFTGRTVGVQCVSGSVLVRRFRYEPVDGLPPVTLADLIAQHHDGD